MYKTTTFSSYINIKYKYIVYKKKQNGHSGATGQKEEEEEEELKHSPIEHSSMSWLQAPPTKPAGQVQMARPFRGFVSHTAPSLQGLLTQASSR